MNVRSYDLFVDLDFRNLKFNGRVLIELQSEQDVVLDSVGLTILETLANHKPVFFREKDGSLEIKTGPFNGIVAIRYSGSIPDTLMGIYRAPYRDTYMITTHFEAADARRMFPCIDHPGYKAVFKLTLKIDRELDAISNMPIESVRMEGDKKVVSFQKTPKMSTYLLYVGVGKFEEIKQRLDNFDLIVAATPGQAKRGQFALEVAERSMEFYQSYFEIPYMLPKLHLISVPEFAAGAMENWGAMTFREAALQVDERSSARTKKRVAEVVAHELAHQWFGNLVTMKWWNDLWLNESFATFMAYKAMEVISPQWKPWQDFLVNQASEAMSRDSLKSTHPIEADVKTPSEIAQIFDEISYGKGACILRMIENYVREESFRKGVRDYLAKHQFSNAGGEDLWSALEEASGRPVRRIMSEWIRKPGYPLVTVMTSGNQLMLKQERFLLSGVSERDSWPIPVTMRLQSQPSRLLLDAEEKILNIQDVRSLKLNLDSMGFYRVYYEELYDAVWKNELSALDKWQVVFDALAFLVSGRMRLSDYLNLVERYYGEQDYAPALEVSNQLTFLHLIMPARVAEASREFHRSQLGVLTGKTDENSLILRGTMAARLVMVDDNYAMKLAGEFKDYGNVEPDMRQAVAIGYARTYNDFENVVKKYRTADSDEERNRLLNAMMNFSERSLVAMTLGLALSSEVKRQDVASAVLAAALNPSIRDMVWTWTKVNIETLRRLHEGTSRLSRVLYATIPPIGIGRVEEVERFFTENEVQEAKKGIEAGLEKLKIYDKLARST